MAEGFQTFSSPPSKMPSSLKPKPASNVSEAVHRADVGALKESRIKIQKQLQALHHPKTQLVTGVCVALKRLRARSGKSTKQR